MPVAVNCCVPLGATVAVEGVTAIDYSATTDRVVVPVTVPELVVEAADMVLVPPVMPVASPEALTVATPVFEDSQLAVAVRSFVVPSLKLPVALNCCVWPGEMDDVAGVTEIDTNDTVLPPPPLPPDDPLPPHPTNRPTPTSRNDSNAFFIRAPPGFHAHELDSWR